MTLLYIYGSLLCIYGINYDRPKSITSSSLTQKSTLIYFPLMHMYYPLRNIPRRQIIYNGTALTGARNICARLSFRPDLI